MSKYFLLGGIAVALAFLLGCGSQGGPSASGPAIIGDAGAIAVHTDQADIDASQISMAL